jgi:hypothetical protein
MTRTGGRCIVGALERSSKGSGRTWWAAFALAVAGCGPGGSFPVDGGLDLWHESPCTLAATCPAVARPIYVLDSGGVLARFDPATVTFTDVATLDCDPPPSPPTTGYSNFAVDRRGTGWAWYWNGETRQVDLATGHCTFVGNVGADGGKAFAASCAGDGSEALFAVGVDNAQTPWRPSLGRVDTTSLAVSWIGPVAGPFAELTGTPDGSLWAIFLDRFPPPHVRPHVARLDQVTGEESEIYPVEVGAGGFALVHSGNSLWIFVGEDVYELRRGSGQLYLRRTGTGRVIIGGGSSTCVE